MSASLAPSGSTTADAAASLLNLGYAVLPGIMDVAERRFASQVHDELIAAQRHLDNGVWGYSLHPLSTIDARLCHIFAHPLLVEVSRLALGEPVVLKHTGSRVEDPAQGVHPQRIPWHNHAFTAELNNLLPGDPRRGGRPRRLLYGWYLDGSDPEVGSLVVLPRRYDDVLAPPSLDRQAPWPGEIAVTAPPGSAVFFTCDVWHTATFGTSGRRRRLTGAHVQAVSCTTPHPADHAFTGSDIREARSRHPRLAEILPSDP